jgi:DNA-binding transcriptional regulator GbsR (MarR family)
VSAPSEPRPAAPDPGGDPDLDPGAEPLPAVVVRAQDEIAEVCAAIAEFWGFTRTQGRIFGLLLMSPEPLDHGTIRTRLDISAGSASMTLQALLEWGVVHRDGRKYRAESDFWKLITHVLQRRERARVDEALARVGAVLAALEAAPGDDPRVRFLRQRLAYVHDFFRLGRSLLHALISKGPVRGILGSLARRATRSLPAAPR